MRRNVCNSARPLERSNAELVHSFQRVFIQEWPSFGYNFHNFNGMYVLLWNKLFSLKVQYSLCDPLLSDHRLRRTLYILGTESLRNNPIEVFEACLSVV